MSGEESVDLDKATLKSFTNVYEHDAHNINAARQLAEETDKIYLGVIYRNEDAPREDE